MPATTAESQLLAKLDQVARRYEAVTAEMNDPAVGASGARIVRLAKEHKALGRMVEPYRRYQKLRDQIAQAQAIAADPAAEAELRQLAEAELPELRAQA